jgi:hypothetical protein
MGDYLDPNLIRNKVARQHYLNTVGQLDCGYFFGKAFNRAS